MLLFFSVRSIPFLCLVQAAVKRNWINAMESISCRACHHPPSPSVIDSFDLSLIIEHQTSTASNRNVCWPYQITRWSQTYQQAYDWCLPIDWWIAWLMNQTDYPLPFHFIDISSIQERRTTEFTDSQTCNLFWLWTIGIYFIFECM